MDRWRQYLFGEHDEATLRRWARTLHVFRYCRAYGGHANDCDTLDAVFPYADVDALVRFCASLDLPLQRYDAAPPQPQPGVAYPGGEFARFPALIPGTRWLRQPGHCVIAGEKAFAWCDGRSIRISASTGPCVTEQDVAAAQRLESRLADAPLRPRDPPTDDRHCICPRHHPDFFAAEDAS